MSFDPTIFAPGQSGPDNGPNHSQVKVKICGLTNLDDACLAAEAGADFLGFIFYAASKRSVMVDAVQSIIAQLRTAPDCPLLVGVFVNETASTMAEILKDCQLDLAQLSGEETPALIGEPDSPIFGRSYKALRPTSLAEAQAESEWYLPPRVMANQPGLLVDTYHPTLKGGTGQTADWAIATALATSIPTLMLAGGLRPDNVAAAVRQVRPFAVDVASGVESSPGRKDPDLVRTFIANAKAA